MTGSQPSNAFWRSVCCNCCSRPPGVSVIPNCMQTVPNLNARFVGDLPQPLRPGHLLVVSGTPESHCTRFSVNLTSGKEANKDLAFHFNPRLEQNYVVRNTRINGYWGEEETTSPYLLDLKRRKKFKLEIILTEKNFIVSLDELHFCTYRYRVPLTKIKHIEIVGDVDIHEVDTREVVEYPLTARGTLFKVPFGDHIVSEKLPNPFNGQLEENLQVGQQVEIYGRVKILPSQFYVNLQEGHLLWPHPQIPIHLNPRFNTTVGAYSLIRNAWHRGNWGQEERTQGFSFAAGKEFHVAIKCEPDSFSVWVDGQMVGVFKYRIPSPVIDTVYIQGDIYIYRVFVSDRNLILNR